MVYFIGAGPGDPELITVKGKRLIQEADVIVYTGSLVNPALLSEIKKTATVYNSASMTLKEVMEVICQAVRDGKKTVRVHTGDPSLYGAVREQMAELSRQGIDYEVIPGLVLFWRRRHRCGGSIHCLGSVRL